MRLILSALLFVLLQIPTTAYAYKDYSDYNLKYGVGAYGASDQHYYVTSSATPYESSIDSAVHDWIYTTSRIGVTTPISYTQTSVQANSRMDLYAGAYWPSSSGIKGATYWMSGSSPVSGGDGVTSTTGPLSDWVWGKIKLNTPNFSDLGAWDRKGVVAHEIGHVFGLAHVTAANAIMWNYTATRTVNTAQKDDLNGINHLY